MQRVPLPIVLSTALALSSCAFAPNPDICHVPPGHVAILVRLEGKTLPPGEFVAPAAAEGGASWQGLQLDVLRAGRHPEVTSDLYSWEVVPEVEVPPESVGILVRRFGAELEEGRVLADEDPADETAGTLRKGILGRTLGPGAHAINTRAYEVMLAPRVTLTAGQVGVVTRMIGPQDAKDSAGGAIGWVATAGSRGVQPEPLPPGTHYLNPYVDVVAPWSRESHRIDLTTPGRRVRFPTLDGFDIALNGTLEWSVPEAAAPALFARYGDLAQVLETLLMPATRAVSRQHGIETAVRDFISGTRRLEFQNALQRDVAALVEPEGPKVNGMTISGVEPPGVLAEIIQQRENSILARAQHLAEIEKTRSFHDVLRAQIEEKRPEAIAKAKKAAQDLVDLLRQKVSEAAIARDAERERLALEGEKSVLEAAAIERQSADELHALAQQVEQQVASLAGRIAAHGGGLAFARAALLERLAPKLSSIELDADPLASWIALASTDTPERKSP